jgi:hypothetical protein
VIDAIAPRPPHWHPARAAQQQSNAVAVPRTVLHCLFLI